MQQSSDKLTITSGSDICETFASEGRKSGNGLIIFYQNAPFFTDLPGDSIGQGDFEPQLYKLYVSEPVGKPTLHNGVQYKIYEKRGLLEEAEELPEPMDLTDNPIPESMELAFPPASSTKCSDEVHGPHSIKLEATGIGGIYPADNFAIHVEVRRARVDPTAAATVPIRNPPGSTHDRLVKTLQVINQQRRVHAAVEYDVASLQRIDFSPSPLPSPLCLMSPEEVSTSEEASSVG